MGACCSCSAEPEVVLDPPTQEEIFENLPVAERKLWRIAFARLDSTKSGRLPADHAPLRVFLSEFTLLSEDDAEQAIGRLATDNLDLEAFNKLMTAATQDDTAALAAFQNCAMGEEETMESRTARDQLRVLGQSRLNIGGDWGETLWGRVLDAALLDVGLHLNMEEWVQRCGMFTRYLLALNQQQRPIL
mmetsp:Transcript_79699/g.200519  ORF Transcript_79699/g.200519 Transcript_79699/m.200519 type:complete len:189 (+) Transcript_79699:101-667(+)